MPVLVHDGEHDGDVPEVLSLYLRHKCLTVEGIVGVFDCLRSEAGDGGGRPSSDGPFVLVDGDTDPGVTVGPVVPTRQVRAALHSYGELGRAAVRVQAGEQREADGWRTLLEVTSVSTGSHISYSPSHHRARDWRWTRGCWPTCCTHLVVTLRTERELLQRGGRRPATGHAGVGGVLPGAGGQAGEEGLLGLGGHHAVLPGGQVDCVGPGVRLAGAHPAVVGQVDSRLLCRPVQSSGQFPLLQLLACSDSQTVSRGTERSISHVCSV